MIIIATQSTRVIVVTKPILLAASLAAVALVVACGGDEESPAQPSTACDSTSPTPAIFKVGVIDASFVTPQIGWVLAAGSTGSASGSGLILSTRNSGATWDQQCTGAFSGSGVQFINDRVGWVFGDCGKESCLLKTVDGGRSWQEIHSVPQHFGGPLSQPVDFVNEQIAWAAVRVNCADAFNRDAHMPVWGLPNNRRRPIVAASRSPT